jgi:hypothetical protein
MTKGLIAAAVAFAALAMPATAFADDAMSGHGATAAPSKMATMACRAAAAGEKPTAMTTGDKKTALVCKTMPAEMMKKGHGPNLSGVLSAEQADAAWREYLQQAVMIPGGTGGG